MGNLPRSPKRDLLHNFDLVYQRTLSRSRHVTSGLALLTPGQCTDLLHCPWSGSMSVKLLYRGCALASSRLLVCILVVRLASMGSRLSFAASNAFIQLVKSFLRTNFST